MSDIRTNNGQTLINALEENERLRQQLEQTELQCRKRIKADRIQCLKRGDDHVRDMAERLEQAEARVAELEAELRDCLDLMRDSEKRYELAKEAPDMRDEIDFIEDLLEKSDGQRFILRKQAEAVEYSANHFGGRDYLEVRLGLSEIAQGFRNQANKLEKDND